MIFDPPHPLPDHEWMVALPRGPGGAILLGTENGLRIVDPSSGRIIDHIQGRERDATVADLDGDGARELVLCGDTGVRSLPWESPTPGRILYETPCHAIARVRAKQTLLITLGATLQRWSVAEQRDLGPFGDGAGSGPLTAYGDRLAVVSEDGDAIHDWGPHGLRILQADGRVSDLAWYDGDWVWITERSLSRPQRTLDGPAVIAEGDEGALLVLQPERSRLDIHSGGDRTQTALPFAATELATADLDADGDIDVVLAGEGQFLVARSTRSTPTETRHQPLPLQTETVSRVSIPLFLATDGALASGRDAPERTMVGGVGIAFGSTLRPGFQTGGSPLFVATMERRVNQHTFVHLGLDSAPLFINAGEGNLDWHLAMLTGGIAAGNPHLRIGGLVTAGLFGGGVGMRTVWTPFETRSMVLHGLELRLTAFTGLGQRTVDESVLEATGEVGIAYVTAFPLGPRRGMDLSAPSISVREPSERPEDLFLCRRFTLGLGLGAGVSSTASSWAFVGQATPWDPSWSPAITAGCETGSANAGMLIAVDSLPFFAYRVPWDDGARDQVLRHMGSVSLGPVFGTDVVRLGPYLTGGIWAAGVGGRIVFTPLSVQAGNTHHGLEIRALALYPPGSAGEGAILYSLWWDPRR